MALIDAHTHIFPPWVRGDRAAYCARDRWFDQLYRSPAAKLASEDDLLASMESAGITHSIVCGFPWADLGLCREHSAWLAEVCRRHPQRLSYMATVVPHAPGAAAAAELAKRAGACGIGELNADAQGFDLIAAPALAELMDACRQLELPVMLHSSEPLGHDYPGKGAAHPNRLAAFLTAFPNQPIVLAHWGGGLPFYELMPEIQAITRNVVYDSAASTYLYRHAVIPTVLNLVGAERVLFASDYPVLSQGKLARRFERTIQDDAERALVLAGNARRVYRIAEEQA